jgi:hypothetical protein
MPPAAESSPQPSAASVLQDEIMVLVRRAESVNSFIPWAYCHIKRLVKLQQQLLPRVDALHNQYRRSLNDVSGPGFGPGVSLTRTSGEGLSALLQVERSWQSLGSVIDRKRAYSFGWCSLYVAGISLLATVTFGIVSLK